METRIREIRKAHKLTQAQFGDIIGVKHAAITSYEKGTRMPSEAVIRAICREFNVNRSWLETGEEPMQAESQSQMLDRIARRYSDSKVFRALLDVYAQLSAEGQDAVEHYIALLSKALEEGRDPATVDPLTETIDPDEDFHSAAQHARDVLPSDEPDGDTKAHA